MATGRVRWAARVSIWVGAAGVSLASVTPAAAAEPVAPKDAPAEGEPAASPKSQAKDVVRLKSGGLLRGSIAELVPGEFVVIVLITGETRRVPADEFEYAGPDRESDEQSEDEENEEDEEEVEEPAPRRSGKIVRSMDHGPMAEMVNVKSTHGEVKVYVRAPADGSGKRFNELCKTPCDVYLEPGEYEMALSELDSNEPMEASDRVRIEGGENIEATYESRASIRAAGVTILLLGSLAGGAIIATAEKERQSSSAQVTIGALIVGGSLAGGIVMLTRSDIVEIDIVPSSASLLPSRGALAGIPDASASRATWPGLGIAARF
jgi:hypothetical protein